MTTQREYPTLQYHEKELALKFSEDGSDPFVTDIDELTDLLQRGYPARIHLEPGDATCYTFVLALVQGNLYITRLVSYDVVGAVCLPLHSRVLDFEIEPLARHNNHTFAVTQWFLQNLLMRLNPED